jgi:hypothetical protein
MFNEALWPVFQIHDILVWIWIRIRGSMPLTNGSGSSYFRHWLSRRQQKNNFQKKFLCLLLCEGTFTLFFKDEKSKRSHKTVGIKVFSYYFCLMTEGSGSLPLTSRSGSGRPQTMWIRIRIRNTACDVRENKRPVLYIGKVLRLWTWAILNFGLLAVNLIERWCNVLYSCSCRGGRRGCRGSAGGCTPADSGPRAAKQALIWITPHQC